MKKASVLLFSICLLGVTVFGLVNNSYYVPPLIDLSTFSIHLRVALIAVLVTYTFVPSLRLYLAKILLGISGVTMLLVGIICIGSPSLFGLFNNFMLIGDAFTLVEGGILALVLSAELYSRESKVMTWSIAHLQLLFATRTTKLIYSSPLLHSEEALKTRLQLKPMLSRNRLVDNFKIYQTDHMPYSIRPAYKYK